MDLRQLRYLVAVAEEGHLTRAAERLGMQQPPLSRQIQALEAELGVRLFRRKPRGVEPTDAGRALLDGARAVLAEAEHAVAMTRRAARGEQGKVAVGLTVSAPFHPFVPRAIRSFGEAFPRVSLVLEEGNTSDLAEGLRNETIDAAFVRSVIAETVGLVVMPILEEELVAALPSRHRLARRRKTALPLEALARETFVLYRLPARPGIYDTIVAACRAAGFTPRVGQQTPRMLSALNLVAAGLGLCVVPSSLQRLNLDGVTFRRLEPSPLLTLPLRLAYRRGEGSAAVRHFIQTVQRMAKDLVAAE